MSRLEETTIPIGVENNSSTAIEDIEKRLEALQKQAESAQNSAGGMQKALDGVSGAGVDKAAQSVTQLQTQLEKVMSLSAGTLATEIKGIGSESANAFVEANRLGAKMESVLAGKGLSGAANQISDLGAQIAALTGGDDDAIAANIAGAIASGKTMGLKEYGIILDDAAKARIKSAEAISAEAGAQATANEVINAGAAAVKTYKDNLDPAAVSIGDLALRLGNLQETAGQGSAQAKAAIIDGLLSPLLSVVEAAPGLTQAGGFVAGLGGEMLEAGDKATEYVEKVKDIGEAYQTVRGFILAARAALLAKLGIQTADTIATEANTIATTELAIAEGAAAGAAGAEAAAAGTAAGANVISGAAAAGASVGFGTLAIALWAVVAPFAAIAAAALAAVAAIALAAKSWDANKDAILNPTSSTEDTRTDAQKGQDAQTESGLDELRGKTANLSKRDKYVALRSLTQKYIDLNLTDKASEVGDEANALRDEFKRGGTKENYTEAETDEGKALVAQIRGTKADTNKAAALDGSNFHGYQKHDFWGNVSEGSAAGDSPESVQAKVDALLKKADDAKSGASAPSPLILPSSVTSPKVVSAAKDATSAKEKEDDAAEHALRQAEKASRAAIQKHATDEEQAAKKERTALSAQTIARGGSPLDESAKRDADTRAALRQLERADAASFARPGLAAMGGAYVAAIPRETYSSVRSIGGGPDFTGQQTGSLTSNYAMDSDGKRITIGTVPVSARETAINAMQKLQAGAMAAYRPPLDIPRGGGSGVDGGGRSSSPLRLTATGAARVEGGKVIVQFAPLEWPLRDMRDGMGVGGARRGRGN